MNVITRNKPNREHAPHVAEFHRECAFFCASVGMSKGHNAKVNPPNIKDLEYALAPLKAAWENSVSPCKADMEFEAKHMDAALKEAKTRPLTHGMEIQVHVISENGKGKKVGIPALKEFYENLPEMLVNGKLVKGAQIMNYDPFSNIARLSNGCELYTYTYPNEVMERGKWLIWDGVKPHIYALREEKIEEAVA